MPLEIFFEDKDSQYGEGLMLQEYNGAYSIIRAGKSYKADGTVYLKWCYPARKEGPSDKMLPFGVRLGSKRNAVKILKYFLEQLTVNE